MLVTVESTGTLGRRMRVELPAERIEKEVDSRLKSVGRTAKIKGFRPGKVPAKVVRKHYGTQVRQEVLTELMSKSYSDAIAQENLQPVARPTIEPQMSGDSNDFVFTATFDVLPEVTLKDLDKIEVTRTEVDITEDDQEEMIMNLRKQRATWAVVERESKEGDRVTVDFDGTIKDEPFPGGKGTEVPVVLGQGSMLPDFESALFGVAAGDEKTFKVKFPKDYHAEDLKGKKVDFAVKVHKVEEEELPPLDDSLAELYGVEEGGLKKLRADVMNNMQREAGQKVLADIKEQALEGLLDANPIEVPNSLKAQEAHSMQHEAMRRLGVEDHDKAPPQSDFEEGAERRVRLSLLVHQLIDDQTIVLDREKLKARIEEMCSSYENANDMVAKYMNDPQIMAQFEPMILEEQAVDWLIENGTEKTRKVSFKEFMQPQANV
jgi:trigger factor